jgi:hypothetical protein
MAAEHLGIYVLWEWSEVLTENKNPTEEGINLSRLKENPKPSSLL